CCSPLPLSNSYSGVLIPYKCDLTRVEDIQSMFAAIKAKHKGVDVCINNAGLAHPEPLLSGKTSGWKNMLDVRTHCCSENLA
ncbi:Dehydrogenase/reductase SDR member 11, partial [Xenoophorus captivus]